MASALRSAATKIGGRAQPYFTAAAKAAVKEEPRRLFPSSISHGGSSVRRFSSSKSPNLVNNSKHAPNSAAGAAETESVSTSPSPWWRRKKSHFPWGFTMTCIASCYAVVYVESRLMYGPPFWWSKEQPDES